MLGDIKIKKVNGKTKFVGRFESMQAIVEFYKKSLHETDLSGLDLSNSQLDSAVMRCCIMKKTNFSGSDISHASLSGNEISFSDFSFCSINESFFNNAKIEETTFRYSSLKQASFQKSFIKNSVFRDTKCYLISFSGSEIKHSIFENSELCNAFFMNASIYETSFCNSDLSLSSFKFADLELVDFRIADISYSNFDFAKIQFSCKFSKMKVSDRYIGQFSYHLTRVDVSNCSKEVIKEIERIRKGPLGNLFLKYRGDIEKINKYNKWEIEEWKEK